MILAVLISCVAVSASASSTLERAARELASAGRAAGVTRVSIAPFASAEGGAGIEAAALLQEFLTRDGRLVAVERSALPRVFTEQAASDGNGPRAGALAAAQAVLAGSVIEANGSRLVLARLIDAETGEILAAAEGTMPGESAASPRPAKDDSPFFPYARIVDRAVVLLDGASGGGEVEDRLSGILEASGGDEPRAAAALALGRLGGARSFGLLVFAAADGKPAVRAAAALALGLRGDDAARVRLDSILRSDPDWRVRDAAAAGLSRARPAAGPAPALADLLVER